LIFRALPPGGAERSSEDLPMRLTTTLRACGIAAALAAGTCIHAAPVTLSKLTGLTGNPSAAATAVYKGDLSTIVGSFVAITITDVSGGFGGAPGQFTGFDLDAIKLSSTNCADAACAATAPGLPVFDFTSGVVFMPGSQRAPADPKLFGTGPGGNTLDDSVARLALFDGVSSTGSDAAGFISLGDNGAIAFNLTALTSTTGLFLYIGEVGDNGEVAGSNIELRDTPVTGLPEPETYAMLVAGIGALAAYTARRRRGER
jgi:hypothetical protein